MATKELIQTTTTPTPTAMKPLNPQKQDGIINTALTGTDELSAPTSAPVDYSAGQGFEMPLEQTMREPSERIGGGGAFEQIESPYAGQALAERSNEPSVDPRSVGYSAGIVGDGLLQTQGGEYAAQAASAPEAPIAATVAEPTAAPQQAPTAAPPAPVVEAPQQAPTAAPAVTPPPAPESQGAYPVASMVGQVQGITPKELEASGYTPAEIAELEKTTAVGYEAGGYEAGGYEAKGYEGTGYEAKGYEVEKAPEAVGYEAEGYTAEGYEALQGVAKTTAENVSDAITRITGKDSPIMQRAVAQATAEANRRGLLNSSMAAGAAQGAILDRAMQIAQGDVQNAQFNVQQQNAMESENIAAANKALEFTANARNAASSFLAGAKNKAAEFLAAEKNQNGRFNAEQANNANEFSAKAANAAAEFAASSRNESEKFNAMQQNLAASFLAEAKNKAAEFGAGEENEAARFMAAAENRAAEINAQETNKRSEFAAQQADIAARFAAEMTQKAGEFNAREFNVAQQRYTDAMNAALAAQIDAENQARQELFKANRQAEQNALDRQNRLEATQISAGASIAAAGASASASMANAAAQREFAAGQAELDRQFRREENEASRQFSSEQAGARVYDNFVSSVGQIMQNTNLTDAGRDAAIRTLAGLANGHPSGTVNINIGG